MLTNSPTTPHNRRPRSVAGRTTVYRRAGGGPRVDVRSVRRFSSRLMRHLEAAGFGRGHFDVTLAGDRDTAALNREFLHKGAPADVLSFPWRDAAEMDAQTTLPGGPLAGFLGDIVISTERARANAQREGHSVQLEVEQLILHGALHLLGWDHATDQGEMDALELRLRRELGIEG